MAITQNDLANLENKIKIEISKEQTELRHEDRKKLSDCVWVVDSLKTDSALSKQSFTTMEKNQEELKVMIKELTSYIKEEMKAMHNVFATKEDLAPIKEKQKSHDEIINRVVWGIVIAFLSLIAWIVWLSKYM